MVRGRGLAGLAAAAALALAACGEKSEPDADVSHVRTITTTTTTTVTKEPAHEGRPALELPRRGHPVVWPRAGARVKLRDRPGGKVLGKLGARTEWGSPTVLSVVERRGAWAGVPTPLRRTGELGWVRLDPRRLIAGSVPWEVRVDLSDFRLELWRDRRIVHEFAVAIGAPDSPTPTGRFAVTDTFRGGLSPAYGCCAVALTARQPSLPSGWMGGDRIAIHGTDGPLGAAISHGCVRARDADVGALVKHVPPGTPVIITQ